MLSRIYLNATRRLENYVQIDFDNHNAKCNLYTWCDNDLYGVWPSVAHTVIIYRRTPTSSENYYSITYERNTSPGYLTIRYLNCILQLSRTQIICRGFIFKLGQQQLQLQLATKPLGFSYERQSISYRVSTFKKVQNNAYEIPNNSSRILPLSNELPRYKQVMGSGHSKLTMVSMVNDKT